MKRLPLIAGAVAMLLGPLLLWALLGATGIGLDEALGLLRGLRPAPVALILALVAAHVALAAEKWRLVEGRLCGQAPSRRRAFAFTAVGGALGQFIPTPLASALIRGGGNHLSAGEGARRGALASVWEQLFDLAVIAVLLAPAAAGLALHDPRIYLVTAPLAALAGDVGIRLCAPLAGRLFRLPPALTERGLCLALYRLSLVRFALLTAMTGAVALAMGSAIPLGPLALAIPPVATATVASFLPSGLGVNEWTFVLVLGLWGVPAPAVAAFGLVNRVLLASISIALGALGAALVDRRVAAPRKAPA